MILLNLFHSINAKQTVIKFNKAIAKDSVIGAAPANSLQNITIVGDASAQTVSALSAELSEDGTELTVTAGTGYFNGDYTVTATDSVKTTANKSLTPYIAKISAEDKVAPVVSKVEYNQVNDKFEVSLSEPITSLTGQVIRVNGNPVSSFDAITGPTKKLSFDRPSGVALGSTATIYVAGLSDAAGNLMTSFNGSAVLKQDQAALTVTSVKQISNNVARVTFNNRLSTASDTALKSKTGVVVTDQNGATTTGYTIVNAPASEDANSLSYDVTFTDASFATNKPEVFTLTLVKDAFTDLVGNKNALFSQTISLSKDNVAPFVTDSKLSSDKKVVEVTLSKPINSGSIDNTKVKLRKDGAELTVVTATLKPNTNNVLLVTTANATAVNGDATFKAGSYQVRFEAEAFADLNGVQNAAVNVAPVAVAATPGSALSVTVGSSGTNIFTVTAPANQTFATGSLAYTNFAIDGKVIPSNSDITLNPTRTVISVKLPTSDSVAISGNALFNVTGLSLESGASVSNASATVAIVDNTAALLTSAQKFGNTLVLTFNEALNSTTAADADIEEVLANYEIKSGSNQVVDGSGAATAALVAGSSNKVQITFSNVTGTNYNASETITITTKSTGGDVTDANGVRVKGGVTVTAN